MHTWKLAEQLLTAYQKDHRESFYTIIHHCRTGCRWIQSSQQNNALIKKYNLLFHHTFHPPWVWNANHSWVAAAVCNAFKIHYKLYQDCKHLCLSAYICIENQYGYAKVFEKILQRSQQFYRSITTLISLYGIFYGFAIWEKYMVPAYLSFFLGER